MSVVTASNGQEYHLWQLPGASTPEIGYTREFDVADVPLIDGYRAGINFGASAGLRKWTLQLPTLASGSVLRTNVSGFTKGKVDRERYIRDVYTDNCITGRPFVWLWQGVYYFVDFEDDTLSMARMKVHIYSTGLTLVQRRLPGVTLPSP